MFAPAIKIMMQPSFQIRKFAVNQFNEDDGLQKIIGSEEAAKARDALREIRKV
jgi:hypothetical protein